MGLGGSKTLLIGALLGAFGASAQTLSWPAGQALPHFPKACLPLHVVDTENLSYAQTVLLASIQGRFNAATATECRTTERRSLYLTKSVTEGKYNWLETLRIPYQNKTYDEILDEYLPLIRCALVYDEALPLTVNLATHLAARRGCVVVDTALGQALKARKPSLDVNAGLIGKYPTKYAVNNRVIEEVEKQKNRPPRILLSLTPRIADGIRELAFALNEEAFVFYMSFVGDEGPRKPKWPLDPSHGNPKDPFAYYIGLIEKFWRTTAQGFTDAKEVAQMATFARSLAPNTLAMGFYEGEVRSIRNMSQHKMPTVVGTSFANYSIWSSLREPLRKQNNARPNSARPMNVEKKLYLNLLVGDGDNTSYVQHHLKTVFDNWRGRGKYALNWTIAPGLADSGPALFNHFIKGATKNDDFVAGPSGLGYFHPAAWGEREAPPKEPIRDRREFDAYWRMTGDYLRKTNLRVVNVVNDRKRLTDEIGAVIRRNCPELLGIANDAVGMPDKADRAYLIDGELPVSSLEQRFTNAEEFRAVLAPLLKEFDAGTQPLFVSLTVESWQKDHSYVNAVLDELKAQGRPVEALRSDRFFPMLKQSLLKARAGANR